MSAHQSVILFGGDLSGRLSELFAAFGYKMTGASECVPGGDLVWQRTNYPQRGKPREIVYKAVLCNGAWTAVLDREMVMIVNGKSCEEFAARAGITVFGYIAEGASGTYAIYKYAPKKVRELFVQEGKVLTDFGGSLPEEEGFANESLFEDGIYRIMERVGFPDSLFADSASKVSIVELDEASFAKAPKANAPKPKLSRPWWKFWK